MSQIAFLNYNFNLNNFPNTKFRAIILFYLYYLLISQLSYILMNVLTNSKGIFFNKKYLSWIIFLKCSFIFFMKEIIETGSLIYYNND